ncbi:hypothetical protein ACTJKK_10605 [Microbacterium sp. 22179]|uniref:hypothetical protein n=1 Tax=Microbacterium sp. 22179 TaxID=3453886 RepID=UPI003F84C468
MTGTIANLVVGSLTVVIGVLIVRYRKALNKRVFDKQTEFFGRRLAQMSAGLQTPTMMGSSVAGLSGSGCA